MICYAYPRRALLATSLLLLPLVAAAQRPAPRPVPRPALFRVLPPEAYPALLGGRVGYGRFRLRGSEVALGSSPTGGAATNEPLAGLALGLVVRARLAGSLAFQTELGYVRKGGRLAGPTAPPNAHFVVDYLQIPALLHLALLRVGPVVLAAEAGYAANLAMGGPDLDYRAYPAGTDVANRGVVPAPVAGAELTLRQGNRRYFLHARYTCDQQDFYRRSFGGQEYALYHAGFTVTTGVLFGFD